MMHKQSGEESMYAYGMYEDAHGRVSSVECRCRCRVSASQLSECAFPAGKIYVVLSVCVRVRVYAYARKYNKIELCMKQKTFGRGAYDVNMT